jgi:GAF domain-containing protein
MAALLSVMCIVYYNRNMSESLTNKESSTLRDILKAALDKETDLIAGLANASAAIKMYLDRVNWAGFYLVRPKKGDSAEQELVLGPFQGLPACPHISWGKGVCGTAALNDETILVADVHHFAGHIACDAASASEIVVPIHKGGKVWGLLDLDSPETGRFGEGEKALLERAAQIIESFLNQGRNQ